MDSRRYKLDELKNEIEHPIDLFIGSASFEDRCLSIAQSLGRGFAAQLIICHTGESKPWVSKRIETFCKMGDEDDVQVVQISMMDPVSTADSLLEALFRIRRSEERQLRVLFDITTFTHETVLIVLHLLLVRCAEEYKRMDARIDVQFGYTPAVEYSVGSARPLDRWLSRGVRQIRSVLGFPGEIDLSKGNCLIVLAGFEPERAAKIIDAYNPEILYLGRTSEKGSVNLSNFEVSETVFKRISYRYRDIRTFRFSGVDPSSSRLAVERIVKKTVGLNVVTAPLNTKISTIGCGLAALRNPHIQLCYAAAEEYNYQHYSRGSDECYIFRTREVTSSGRSPAVASSQGSKR